ncbi:MAG TPA: hypothetical protein VJY54_06690, partial [Lachnospiraceae bacterium]|nr:hypothetical protein [Lachnospiraceae bacterium]
KELAKPGVNLSLLWTEYCEDAYSNGKTPYMYSQFCDKYVFCKYFLDKVAKYFWTLLHVQIGQSCKAVASRA